MLSYKLFHTARNFLTITLFLCSSLHIGFTQAATTSPVLPQKIFFQNLIAKADISIGEIEVVKQDTQGFIWLGGRNALVRYDGYNFEPIMLRIAPNDPSQDIPASHVVDIFEDDNQKLWVATRKGVIWYDREQKLAFRFLKKEGQNHSLDKSTINKISQAPSGEILIGSYGGLNIINSSTLDVTVIQHNSQKTTSKVHLSNDVVHDIALDKDGQHIWLASEKGLSKMHWSEKTFQHFLPNPQNPDSLPDNDIWMIEFDHTGKLWAGSHSGVYVFNTATQTFTQRFQHDPNNRFSISANLIREILVDSLGLIWIGTDGGGLNLWDASNQRFMRFTHEKGQKGTLTSNSTRAMFEDSNGDLWIGTYPEGMNFFDRSSGATSLYNNNPNNTNSLPHNSVLTLQEDVKQNLWIGTDGGGISYFDRFAGTLKHYQTQNKKVGSNAILSSFTDSQNRLWIGTWGAGVLRYNPTLDSFDQIPFDPSLKGKGSGNYPALNDEAVWGIFEDSKGYMWFGTHGGGLSRYDETTGNFKNYSHNREDNSTIANQLVWSIFEDSLHRLWIGTSNGLDILNPETGIATHFFASDANANSLSNNSVLCAFEDSKNQLWFGTDRGLNLLNKNNTFTIYDKSTGFVNDGIRSITEDNNGTLWLGTNNGIINFNPETKSVINYERIGGEKLGGFNTKSVITSQQGEVIFGGNAGLRTFTVDEITTNKTPPKVALTQFSVFTKPVKINDEDGLIDKDINLIDSITLDYKQNMFAFEFAALNFRDSAKNQYAYKLEGFDKNWREVGNHRSALYTNLDAGTYFFKVKASNNDNLWNESGKTIQLIQLPPPWKTWWAYSLYTLIILAIIAQFINAQRQKRLRIELQKQKLEVMVNERTKELDAKNKDVQSMLQNMRQGLFTIQSDGTIHSEYSHFLEEIFNTENLAGKNACELLFSHNQMGGDALNQAQEAINSMLGEDEINFTFNSHALPAELSRIRNLNSDSQQSPDHQYLAISWDPIIEEGLINKLMVSVRDITELKQAESDAQAQKRELSLIGQLIKIPHKKFVSFDEAGTQFLAENKTQIEKAQQPNEELLALLFRNMHTIKGNCRTYGFSLLSDVVHDVETTYSHLKKTLGEEDFVWSKDALLNDIQRVSDALNEYTHVYYNVLGNGDQEVQSSLNLPLLDINTLSHIHQCITTSYHEHPNISQAAPLQSAKILLDIALTNTLSHVLNDIVNSLPSIAKQLDKEPPNVLIDNSNIRINAGAHELLNNVFAHLLRNSVDHGIEPPRERTKAGKDPVGTINLTSSISQNQLCLRLQDDGKGINIQRLREKGVEANHWPDGEPTIQQVANYIFASGASTKEEVTSISGRGVGMDAVKQFLRNAGGDIELNLLAEKNTDNDYIPFETLIMLPPCFYTVIKYEE